MVHKQHQSICALPLSDTSRDQGLQWTKRQLEARGGFFDFTENSSRESDRAVEKDGTGITTIEADRYTNMDALANITKDVFSEHGSSTCLHNVLNDPFWRNEEPTWH